MDSYLEISDDAWLVDKPYMFGELRGCIFIQIDSYEDPRGSAFETGKLKSEEEIIQWTNNQPERKANEKQLINTFKILVFPASATQPYKTPLPITKSLYLAIHKAFLLSPSFLTIFKEITTSAFRSPADIAGDKIIKYVFQDDLVPYPGVAFSLALTINQTSQVTTALIFGLPDFCLPDLINKMQKAKHLASTPFLLPLVLETMAIENSQVRKQEIDRRLANIERCISVRNDPKREDNSISDDENQNRKRSDLAEALREHNSIILGLEYEGRWAAFASVFLDSLVRILENYMNDNKPAGSDYTFQCQNVILSRIQQLRCLVDAVKIGKEYFIKRSQSQVQTIFSLIAQKDSAINYEMSQATHKIAELSRKDNMAMRAIAEDSKAVALLAARDSASMRVIAVVTILFLPATFTATLFSTTFFNFQNPSQPQVVSGWIWLYWLVTVLLTIIIQTGWWLTSRHKEQKIVQALATVARTEGDYEKGMEEVDEILAEEEVRVVGPSVVQNVVLGQDSKDVAATAMAMSGAPAENVGAIDGILGNGKTI